MNGGLDPELSESVELRVSSEISIKCVYYVSDHGTHLLIFLLTWMYFTYLRGCIHTPHVHSPNLFKAKPSHVTVLCSLI